MDVITALLILFTAGAVDQARPAQPFGLMRCEPSAPQDLGTIRIPQPVLADGKPLLAGSYRVRLTTQVPPPPVGQSPTGACWLEFTVDDVVVARELATVVPADAIATIAKGPVPKTGASRVDVLKDNDYVRVWFNRGDAHYIVNLPTAAASVR